MEGRLLEKDRVVVVRGGTQVRGRVAGFQDGKVRVTTEKGDEGSLHEPDAVIALYRYEAAPAPMRRVDLLPPSRC
jgi:hypothetical protein